MLQTFAGERGASRRSAQQETAHPHVRGGPDEIRNPLEPEHRVINKERNCVDALRRVGRARRNERTHRPRFGDALLEDLPVFFFVVVQQGVDVHRLVFLSHARIDSDRAEQRLHAKCARFVRNNRHNQFADLGILQHLFQNADERHGGGNFAAFAARCKFLEEFAVVGDQSLGPRAARRNIAPQFLAPRVQVLQLLGVFLRTIEGNVRHLLVAERNIKTRAEYF